MSTSSSKKVPLAHLLRPQTLENYVGQSHLIGIGKPLQTLICGKFLPSMILWGPPGCGKTTIARLVAQDRPFFTISAVLSGVSALRALISEIQAETQQVILFIDEIHRWNKAQQDALLPYVESGTITLIGATTENPSFEIIAPLLSRARVFTLKSLSKKEIRVILDRAQAHVDLNLPEDVVEGLCEAADGDARQALNLFEMVMNSESDMTLSGLLTLLQKKQLRYDKAGEGHYDTISAFIKSMRGSDPNAAVYYLARMLEAGEDPRFIARRMIIFASEDVGNADPRALQVAVSAAEAFDRVGLAEGWIPLSQAVVYLATAPKSNASYAAYKGALQDVVSHGNLEIPFHIRNAPTKLMKALNYAKGYEYAHSDGDAVVKHTHLPKLLIHKKYYAPTKRGYEKIISERLDWLAEQKHKKL